MRAGGRRGDEDHEEADRLEEETKCLHAGGGEITRVAAAPVQNNVDQVHRDPEDGREAPAGDPPAGEQEDGERDEEDDAAAERREQVIRLRPGRQERARCLPHDALPYRR
jgi:hypothetical protein